MKQKFSKPIFGDEDARHTGCPEVVGQHLANQLSHFSSAIELCCGVGITAIQLAKKMGRITAVDINRKRINDAKKNAKKYGVEDRIKFIVGDVLDCNLLKNLPADVAFLDPDWAAGGTGESIRHVHVNSVDHTKPSMRKMYILTKQYITPNIVIKVPKNFAFEALSDFGCCRLENIAYGGEVQFKLAYFLKDIMENNEAGFSFD